VFVACSLTSQTSVETPPPGRSHAATSGLGYAQVASSHHSQTGTSTQLTPQSNRYFNPAHRSNRYLSPLWCTCANDVTGTAFTSARHGVPVLTRLQVRPLLQPVMAYLC